MMKLYLLSLVFSTLLLAANGILSNIEISSDGKTTSTGEVFNAKLGVKVIIKCNLNRIWTYDETLSLKYKKTPSSTPQEIFSATSEYKEPWASRQENYIRIINHKTEPYFMSFEIAVIGREDAGSYVCFVKNLENEVVGELEGTIAVAANVESVELKGAVDDVYKVPDNEQRLVECLAFNGSEPKMNLTIGDQEPLVLRVTTKTTGDLVEYSGTTFHKFSADDIGKEIKCKAIVPGYESDVMFDRAILDVQASPVISCPDEVFGNINDVVNIPCTVIGKPMPDINDIYWTVEDTGDTILADEKKSNQGLESTIDEENGVYSVKLKITLKYSRDFGTYVLHAGNTGGNSEKRFSVSKKVARGPVGGAEANMSAYSLLLLLLSGLLLI